jgi:hypothetical protein
MSTRISVPNVRTFWDAQGGIYAGTVHPRDGMPAYPLVVSLSDESHIAPARFCRLDATLPPSSHWDGRGNMRSLLLADPGNPIATQIRALRIGGHADWHWPYKLECAVLYANLGDLIYAYLRAHPRGQQWATWICQRSRDMETAFIHDWKQGGQTHTRRAGEFTALVVRRIDYTSLFGH